MRDVALRKRDDPHAGEGHALEEPCNVLLIAAEPVRGVMREVGIGVNDVVIGLKDMLK
ncbi:hypothetical protein [Bradyrhizobium sp. Leo121]|uniref:hypothetical protein n=1 Tax=Bradyrhizobium sp. Leo121 TaxID=1571195 RepID=UPI0013EEED52|nr:hypothetical protein [Bradyrhizobium sp. Leo121]